MTALIENDHTYFYTFEKMWVLILFRNLVLRQALLPWLWQRKRCEEEQLEQEEGASSDLGMVMMRSRGGGGEGERGGA